MAQTRWYLKAIHGNNTNTVFPLTKNTLIGSTKHAQIRVFGENIKKNQCVIQINNDVVNILDISKKGIRINDQRCEIFQELFHNDVITLNKPRFRSNLNTEHSFIIQNIDFIPYETVDLTQITQHPTLIEVSTVSFTPLENNMIQGYNMSSDNFNFQDTFNPTENLNPRDDFIQRFENFIQMHRDNSH